MILLYCTIPHYIVLILVLLFFWVLNNSVLDSVEIFVVGYRALFCTVEYHIVLYYISLYFVAMC